jgi:iron complex outermembrane receptor protein
MFFNSNAGARFARTLLYSASAGAMATFIASPALAQTAAADEGVETVVVTGTGTLIKGINAVGSNLISIDADAMKQGGALTSNQILEQVPQLANAFNNNVAAPTAGNFSGFRPQLRSLPSQNIVGGSATLLLMDGQNMVGVSALGTAPDASMVPTVALQRVDVLPDGASATYGANAITGVINFITRDRFDGFQVETDVGAADSYSSFHAAAIGGTSWAGGSAYLAIDHTDNTVLLGGDRSYTRMDLTNIGGRDSRSTTCALPNITAGGKIYAQTGYPDGTPGSLAANVQQAPGLNAVTNQGGGNRCDTNALTSTYPSVNQTGIFGSVRQEIADGIVFDTKMVWNTRYQFSLNPALSSTQTITSANPFFQSIAGETSQRVQFSFEPYLGKNQRRTQNTVQVFQISPRLTAALPFGDWEAVWTGNYGRSSTNAVQTHNLNSALLTTAITSGVGGAYFNPYNIGLTDSTLLGNLLGAQSGQQARQHLLQTQLTFDGTVFELPGGPVKVAIGGKYDWEDYSSAWNTTTAVPTRVGIHRVVTSGFGEIHVPVVSDANAMPLVHSLDLDVSGRIDNYSVFGSTANFKLGLSWQPFEDFTLRATRGTSYDAPSLADTSAPDGRYQLTVYNAPNPYVPPGTSLADSLRPSILVPGGNPNLGPEKGSTWSIGGELRPTSDWGGLDLTGLDVNVTYYHVSIEHQIGLLFNNLQEFAIPSYSWLYMINPSVQQASIYGYTNLSNFPGTTLASAWGTSPAGGGPNDPYILYDARRNNLGNAILSGIDFSAQYASDFDFGTLSAGFSGTYSLENQTAASASAPYVSIQNYTVPLYAVSAFTQLVTGPITVRGSLNFTPSFRVDPSTQAFKLYGQKRIGSFATVNLHAGYDLSDWSSWLDQTEIGVTVNNVLDADPPIYLHGGPNLPANSGIGIIASGGTLGRYFLMSLQKTF